MNEQVLNEAEKNLPGFDYLADLYDLNFLHASPKVTEVTGFSNEELIKMRLPEIVADDEATYRQQLVERMLKGSGEVDLTIRRRADTNIIIKIQYSIFSFSGGEYLAGKIVSTSTV